MPVYSACALTYGKYCPHGNTDSSLAAEVHIWVWLNPRLMLMDCVKGERCWRGGILYPLQGLQSRSFCSLVAAPGLSHLCPSFSGPFLGDCAQKSDKSAFCILHTCEQVPSLGQWTVVRATGFPSTAGPGALVGGRRGQRWSHSIEALCVVPGTSPSQSSGLLPLPSHNLARTNCSPARQ